MLPPSRGHSESSKGDSQDSIVSWLHATWIDQGDRNQLSWHKLEELLYIVQTRPLWAENQEPKADREWNYMKQASVWNHSPQVGKWAVEE